MEEIHVTKDTFVVNKKILEQESDRIVYTAEILHKPSGKRYPFKCTKIDHTKSKEKC